MKKLEGVNEPEPIIGYTCERTASPLILGPSRPRTSENTVLHHQEMQYAPLNPLRCNPLAKVMVNWGVYKVSSNKKKGSSESSFHTTN
jgi:hypothetical protein